MCVLCLLLCCRVSFCLYCNGVDLFVAVGGLFVLCWCVVCEWCVVCIVGVISVLRWCLVGIVLCWFCGVCWFVLWCVLYVDVVRGVCCCVVLVLVLVFGCVVCVAFIVVGVVWLWRRMVVCCYCCSGLCIALCFRLRVVRSCVCSYVLIVGLCCVLLVGVVCCVMCVC